MVFRILEDSTEGRKSLLGKEITASLWAAQQQMKFMICSFISAINMFHISVSVSSFKSPKERISLLGCNRSSSWDYSWACPSSHSFIAELGHLSWLPALFLFHSIISSCRTGRQLEHQGKSLQGCWNDTYSVDKHWLGYFLKKSFYWISEVFRYLQVPCVSLTYKN